MDRRIREAERRYQSESTADNLYKLHLVRMRSGVYEANEDVIEAIVAAAARAFFVTSWADEMEHQGTMPSGVELLDAAPPTPPDAVEFTQEYIREVERFKKLPIDEFYRFVEELPRDPYWDRDYTPENFGHYLALSGRGQEPGLADIVPPDLESWVEVPYTEEYQYDEFTSRIGELTEDPEIQQQILGLVSGNIDAENYENVDRWLRQTYHRPSESASIMTAIDELLDGHGIESFEIGDTVVSYVNMGDTYIMTVLFDGDYHISSWGDYVTEMETQNEEDEDWDEETYY